MAGEHLVGFDPSQLTPEEVEAVRALSDDPALTSPTHSVFDTPQGRATVGREDDPEKLGLVSSLAVSGLVGAATGGMSIPTQIGAQMLAGTGAATLNSAMNGDIQEKGWEDVLTDARNEGFLWGGATAGAAGLAKGARLGATALADSRLGQFAQTKIGGPVGAFVRERLDKLAQSGGVGASASRLVRERLGIPNQNVQLPSPSGLSGRYSNVLTDNAAAAETFALDQGTTLPLGNTVRSKFVDIAQNIATSALTGSRIEKLTFANERVTQKYINQVINEMPRLSPQDTGRFVTALTREGNTFRGAVAEGHYQMVDDALAAKYGVPRDVRLPANERLGDLGGARAHYMNTPQYPAQPRTIIGNGVDISSLQAQARATMEEYQKLGVTIPGEIKALATREETLIPWSEAQRMRSSLFSLSQQFERGTTEISPVLKGRATLLSGNLTNLMENTASKAPLEVRDALQTANRIWREEMRGTYEKDFAVKLADEQPHEVMKALLATRDPDDVRAMRALVAKGAAARTPGVTGEAAKGAQDEAFAKVQGSFIGHLIDQVSNEVILPGGKVANYRKVDPTALRDLIDKVGKEGGNGEIFKAWGVEDQINNLRNAANFGALNAAGAGGGHTGSVWFQMAQAGVAAGALQFALNGDMSGAATTGTAVFTLAPVAINRLFSDPAIVRWLTIGGAAPPRSRIGAKVILMTLGKLAQQGLLQDDDIPRAEHAIAGAQRQLGLPTTGSFTGEARLTAEEQAQVNAVNTRDYGQIVEERALSKDTKAYDARQDAEAALEAKRQQLIEMLGQPQ